MLKVTVKTRDAEILGMHDRVKSAEERSQESIREH